MNNIGKKTGYFNSFDGTPIYYELRGHGKPLVFCYGIGCLINHWHHQIKHFSQHYQTLVFDYRGHHQSGIPDERENITIDAIARDMNGLLGHLDIQKASIWGHSFGAQVLLKTYDVYPEVFENIVIVNGFASNPIKGMFGTDLTTSAFHLIKEGYNQLPETIKYLWRTGVNNPIAGYLMSFGGGFNIELTSFKDIEVYAKAIANIDLDVFINLFEQMISYDATPVLSKVDVPCLIIAGNKDAVTPLKHQEALHQKIKKSQFISIPYGTHCTQLDLPEFVNLRIEKFLHELKFE